MTKLAAVAATVRARWLDWASFLVPLAVSLAANTVWGLMTGSMVMLVAGLVTPLLLVLAVERWQKLPPYRGLLRGLQIVGMAAVAGVAAAWSGVHTAGLLLAQAPDSSQLTAALCIAAPLAVDGLAVLSVLSLGHSPALPAAAKDAEQAAEEVAPSSAEQDEPWGGPAAVDGQAEPAPLRALPTRPARSRTRTQRAAASSAAGGRTKRELEARAKELRLKRSDANESKASLAARVEAREAELRHETSARPIPARTEGVPA